MQIEEGLVTSCRPFVVHMSVTATMAEIVAQEHR